MATKEELDALRRRFDELKHDPVLLGSWLFGSRYWDKQKQIMRSVWENKKTAVKSCNSGGKSRISAEIALLYLLAFRPSRVITTAPTFLQVEEILWKEIHALYHKSRIKFNGHITKTSLSMGTYGGRPWDMLGISTNEENRMQGFKSPHLLVILDEALGIDPIIFRAVEGLHPHRVLAIGNPLEPVGDFFNCFTSDLWEKLTISGLECVEWQEKHGAIPGLITREWIEERGYEWGPNSSMYRARVLGEFPDQGENTLIQRVWVDNCRNNKLEENEQDSARVEACDVASKHGKCETCIGYRYGHTIVEMKSWREIRTTETRNILALDYLKRKLDGLCIDADGIGEGLDDMLYEKHVPFYAFHGGHGQKAIDKLKYKNLRTQFYWFVARKLEKGMYDLSKLSEKQFEILKNQLCQIETKAPDPIGRMQIETKEDMAARGIQSPDYADTFVYLEYAFWMGRYSDMKACSYR